ncbi:MAG: putative inner membrane protein [Candidatus Methanofastidiosum methylothiophilum]|uniref:Putative inner membrane protein n=1 Tax=Candidatus Methanofastidiosum methylothiophilum TaxID=1705564 RepID=A0A150IMQ8_9EURY|nr:MAG: putative inner membrane protein [Candidatus Methanofastidiosum methylthiophilus]KYC48412.1 MAG: putative inner membrane protein [Candidatus Methanofastidiosum methylthiophilus]KYC51076.1 MAG: putative inner membrane protein [Candidatus Methanofastidiosum methylthiophilus]
MDRISYTKIVMSVLIILLGVYLVYPVIPGLIGGFVFAYTFLPVYHKVFNKLKRNNLSAAITTLFVSAPLLVTLLYIFLKALDELDIVIEILRTHSYISILKIFGINFTESPFYEFMLEAFPQIVDITVLFSKTLSQIPLTLLNMVILILSLYYFLAEREHIERFITKVLPPSYHKDLLEILQPTKKVIDGLIYGNIMSAMITGLLAIIGFAVLGIPYSFLLGLLVGLASLLPIIGPWTVFVPLGAYYLFIGNYLKGAALLIYGIVLLGILYNIHIYPKFPEKEYQLHPFIVLIGFFGGFYMFGPIGLLYGPIIIGLLKGVAEGVVKETTQKRRFFRL